MTAVKWELDRVFTVHICSFVMRASIIQGLEHCLLGYAGIYVLERRHWSSGMGIRPEVAEWAAGGILRIFVGRLFVYLYLII